jgi:hypothetical protein
MKRDGTCRCEPSYEFYKNGLDNSDIDSDQDCIPIVRPLCKPQEIRTEGGKCSSKSDCTECTNGGKKDPDTGVCFCENEPSIYEVCNADCRDATPKVTLNSDGKFEVLYPGRTTAEVVDFQSTTGYVGQVYCYSDLSCGVSTVEMSTSGVFQSNYQPNAILNQTTSGRRRLESSSYLESPVYCLNLGETMVFSIPSSDHYPVYKKDSLLVSNSSADFGPFLELKNLIEDGSNISSFAYTFRDPGTYVFADKGNDDQILIVKVVNEYSTCSTPYIRERSPAALTTAGVTQDDDVTTEADWGMIGLVLAFITSFLAFLASIFYFHRRISIRRHKAKMQRIKEQLEDNDQLIELGDNEILADTSSFFRPRADINPQVFHDIYAQLMDNYDSLKRQLEDKDKLDNSQVETLRKATESLKETVSQMLKGKRPEFVDSIFVREEPEANKPEQVLLDSANVLGPKMKQLDPDQKKQLMQEMEEQRLKLQAQMSEERVQAEQSLKGRLDERARRRRALLEEQQRLKEKAEDLTDQINRTAKESSILVREAEKEFDIEKRKAKEKVIGKPAKDLKRLLNEAILAEPDREAELMREYDRNLQDLLSTLDDSKRRQLSDLDRRLEERRAQRQAQARLRLKSTDLSSDELAHTKIELEKIEKQLRLLEYIDHGDQASSLSTEDQLRLSLAPKPRVEASKPVDSSLSEAEEAAIAKKYDVAADETTRNHEAQLQNLQAQRQKLAQSLSSATDSQRAELLKRLDDIDSQIERAKEQQMSRQKQLLEERLQERRRLREMKRMQAERNAASQTSDKATSEAQLRKIEELINSLPKNEKLDAARSVLADKHDKELVAFQRAQQEQGSQLQAEHLKDMMEEKAAAMRVIKEHFGGELEPVEQKRLVDSMLGKPDDDFDQRWQAYKKQCNDDLLELLERQLDELNQLMKRLGLENDPELNEKREELEGDFERRKQEMEDVAQRQLEALNRKQEELQAKKLAQQAEIAASQERLRKQAEVERARKELEQKQREEREAMERKGNMTHKQMDELIKTHERELAQLEQAMMTEKERQQEAVRQKLKEKRERQAKLLDLPTDMRALAPATVSLLQQWRRGYHTDTVELSDDLLHELLARVQRIEKIVKNVDASQFQETMGALDEARKLLANIS